MNQPWLDHYDEGVPRSIGNYPDRTLADFVADHARTRGDKAAIMFKGRNVTWTELDRDSDSFARALAARGVKPGDRVALLLPNCPQFMIAELAAWKLGAIVAPQNPIYTERELEQSMNASASETVIVLTPFYERVKAAQPRTSLKRVIATNIKEYLPGLLRVLFTLAKEKKEGHRITLQAGDHWMQDLIGEGAKSNAALRGAKPDEPAVILMSGGTTGTPKGVVSEHRSLVMSGTQLSAWLREAIAGDDARIMLPLPLFHTYGAAGAQSLALISGIPLALIPNPRDVGDVVKSIARDKPSLFCGVPTLFTALLNHPDVAGRKVDFTSIKACFSGAAALMAETKKRFEELTGGRIVEGYSLTEATMAAFVNPFRGANKIGSVGMPMPDVKVRIVDGDDGKTDLPSGDVGEVIVSAPQLMRGYWNNPDETAQMLRIGDDGTTWLYTGDLGYVDEDGYLFLVDRKKDLIKTSGYQVWPREIEEVLAAHPSVAEVGVAGVPDERKGEIITAWVVARSGQTCDPETLRLYCKEKLAPYKVPAKIELRTELPKTMVGKVLRRMLVAEAKEKMVAG